MTSHHSRRSFLQGLGASLATTAFAAASSSSAAAAKPRLTIIDTHTHFYDPHRPQGVPWPPKDDQLLYRTVLPSDYQALPVPQPVAGTVVVEASPWLEDNQWILDLAANDVFLVGFVGNLPVGKEEFARQHFRRFAAQRLFRGVRLGAGQLQQGLSNQRFRADLNLLADRNLCLDLLGGPDMLPAVAQLAEAAPGLRMVIDHVANLRIDGKAPPVDWVRGMQSAARCKNVSCKVSGLVEGTGRTDGTAPRDAGFYQPVLDAIWSAFGEERLVYGSNWPVSERFAPLATVQQIVHDYFSAKGKTALENVFWKNAKAIYKWVNR